MDDLLAASRRAWLALEPIHVLGYFAPETQHTYAELGVTGRDGYFGSRAAAMGAVDPAVVVASFYVFAPRAVHASLPSVWETTTPFHMIEARYAGMAAVLHRVLGRSEVGEALELARTACDGLTVHGRPVYAGHAAVPWPEQPMMALWHASTLLREHRGDGHVNALLHAGLAPLESLILNGVVAGSTPFMQRRRGWTTEEWEATRADLARQGLLTEEQQLTARGAELVAAIEAQTDRSALEGWARLGADGCERLVELVAPLRAAALSAPGTPDWLASRR